MTARFATDDEINNWNSLIIKNSAGGNIFASFEYGEQKRMTGYRPIHVVVDNIAVLVLEKSTSPLGKLWYLPKGPEVKDVFQLKIIINKISRLAKKHGVFLLKIESELPIRDSNSLTKDGFIKSSPIIPNPSTIILDISDNIDVILTSLPQKGRHAIRRAERDGVTARPVEASDKNCEKMYSLLEETAKDQFGIRNYEYFKNFWQNFEAAGLGQLFFAKFEGKVVAGAFAMYLGEKSTYKDGASVRERTAYGASHLLQWEVIKWAKSKGAKTHDFCGSPPSTEINNTEHPHYGVGRFKLSLSKNVVDYIGCYDKPLSNFKYKLWKNGIERIHRGLYYRLKKDYYY